MTAKRIIISSPLSFTVTGIFLRRLFKSQIDKLDTSLQVWALAQSDSFSREEWENLQFKKLKKILCHASKNVPFWEKHFNEIGFNPEKMSSTEDIKKIPVMRRIELKEIPIVDLLATNIQKSRMVQSFTSGSTGEPFQLYRDRKELFRRRINNFQEFRYVGFDINSGKVLVINLYPHKDLDDLGRRIDIRDIEDENKRKAIIYPLISAMKPKMLMSTPSYLERFLSICEKDGFRPQIDKICYMGEQLDSKLKEKLGSYFGAYVYSSYGTSETSLIGIQCEEGSQHLAPWMNFVESIDGKLIVTTFENDVMPFIRYEIGDEGEILDDYCKCGRFSKLIKFKGRTTGFVELADGSTGQLLSTVQYLAEEYSNRIRKFQFGQTVGGKLHMRYVPVDSSESASIEKDLKKYFHSIFQNKVEMTFSSIDNMEPDARGKTPLFIKKINAIHE